MTEAEHEDQLIDRVMAAIGEASRLGAGADRTVAIHIDVTRRALQRCLWIVEHLDEVAVTARRDVGRA